MLALIIAGGAAIILLLAAGAYRLAFWHGVNGHPQPGRIRHVTYSPGYELSGFQNAVRAMAWVARHRNQFGSGS